MNQHDSQRIAGLMAQEGYVLTDVAEDADLIVFNSCSVREKAEQKLLSAAGAVRKYKKRNPGVVVAIGGCVAQQEGERLLARASHVDVVFGPDHLGRLPELVRKARSDRKQRGETEFLSREAYRFPSLADTDAAGPVSAFVSIMKGCDKMCSFCIVPFTRGREVSRSADEILREVRHLAEKGTKEVVLLGQTVNSYGRRRQEGQPPFHVLLAQVAEVEGIERIRFTSPHPAEFSSEQIAAFRDIPKLCPHMHLPVQSGSTRVLEAMRRGYSRADYLDIVQELRSVAPMVSLTTDVIVGFPGEREEDFADTMSLLETVRFQGAFSFAYSERTGTRAIDLPDSVPVAVRSERLQVLQARQEEITQEALQGMLGQQVEVLIEGPSKSDPEKSTGRTGQNQPVHVDGILPPGTLTTVRVAEAYKHSLRGERCA